jgi:hypothetical protein
MTLSPKEEAIAQRVAELVAPVKPGPILTRAEAMAYTKHNSDSAFDRWCSKYYRGGSDERGRYSRGHLERALLREAGPGAKAA